MALIVNGLEQRASRSLSKKQTGKTGSGFSFEEIAKQQYVENCREVGSMTPGWIGSDLNQYKQEIYDKISKMKIHPSKLNADIDVFITDAGFEAMLQDSEYEKWVLGTLEKNFAAADWQCVLSGGGYNIYMFGADEEEYRSESFYPEDRREAEEQKYRKEAQKSFWEKRAESHRKRMEMAVVESKKMHIHRQIENREQEKREVMRDPDKEKDAYLSGVPASELLAMLS